MERIAQNTYVGSDGGVYVYMADRVDPVKCAQIESSADGKMSYFEYFKQTRDFMPNVTDDFYANWFTRNITEPVKRTLDKAGQTKIAMAFKDSKLGQAGAQFQNWSKEQANTLAQSKAFQMAKTATLSPIRVSYLGLLRINALGYASDLKKFKDTDPARYKKARDTWYKLGGNRTNFDEVVVKGSKEKPVATFLKKGADGSDMYPTGVDEILAMIATAAPAIAAIAKAVGSIIGQKDANIDKIVNTNADPSIVAGATQGGDIPNDATDNPNELSSVPSWVWRTVGGVFTLAFVSILIYTLRKK